MSTMFSKVYTIDKTDVLFNEAKQNLLDISNITMLKGDTIEYLYDILDNNDNILFLIDAHWGGGDTYGEEDGSPLIEELEIIFVYSKNCVILIDDAILFLAPTPYPHNFRNCPSIKDMFNVMPQNWGVFEYEDVIYLYPIVIEEKLKDFIQKDITEKIKSENNISFLQRVLKKMGICK